MFSIKTGERYDKKLIKFLKKHPELRAPYLKILELLRENPFSPELDAKALRGNLNGYYRVRVKRDSRIMYEVKIENQVVILLRVGMRKDFY